MMLPGVVLKKFKLAGEDFGRGLSNLVLYIAQPALIVYAYLSCESDFSAIWQNCLATLLLSVLAHMLFSATALALFRRYPDGRRRMLRMTTIFSNAAFMGIPLIQSILGSEAAIYASIYNITFNIFLWTLGVHLCTRQDGEDMDGDGDSDIADELLSAKKHIGREVSLLKLLTHPVTLASVIGVILLVTGVNVAALESVGLSLVSDSLAMLRSLVAPLSMVVIGLRLANMSLKGAFSDTGMYLFLALRHFILPLAMVLVIKLLTIVGLPISEVASTVTVILASTPSASSATMFAEKYNCDATYTSRLVIISTIISIASMPAVLALSQLIL